MGVIIGPRVLLEHGVGWQWHTGIVHCQELLLVKVLLVLDIKPNIIDILLRNWQFVLPLLVLRVILHSLHLIVIAWLILIALHNLVVSQWAAVEVWLVHLHRVNLLCKVAAASQDVHIQHWTATTIWWSSRVRHASEALTMHAYSHSTGHLTVHLLVEVHHVQWVSHLLLMHKYVCIIGISLINHHIVDANLTFSPTLLRRHRHVIWLVHGILMSGTLVMVANLTTLPLRILCFRIRILHYLVHMNLISDRRWRLWVLLSVTITSMIIKVVCVLLHSRKLMTLPMMNIIFASARCCASRIWINTTNSIIRIVCVLPTDHFVDACARLHIILGATSLIILTNINCTSIMTAFTESTAFGSGAAVSNINILCNGVCLEATLGLHRSQKGIRNIFANNASSSTNYAWARLNIRTGNYSTIINHVLATAGKIKINIVVIILISRIIQRSQIWVRIRKSFLLLHGFIELVVVYWVDGWAATVERVVWASHIYKSITGSVLWLCDYHILLTAIHFTSLWRKWGAASMNNILRMLVSCSLLGLYVVHVALLHMIIVFTPPGWLNTGVVAGMAVWVLIGEVEVTSILRGAIISGAGLTIPLIQ